MNIPFIRRIKATGWYGWARERRHLWRNRTRRTFYKSLIASDQIVFDIGANRGHYSRIFCSLGAKVVAIEPQKALADRLEERFAAEIKRGKFSIENCALGAEPGTAELLKASALDEIASLRKDISEISRFSDEYKFDESEVVRLSTLDRLIDQYGLPGFCKIDVEGFEDAVMEGLSVQIPRLSFEFNSEFIDVARRALDRLDNLAPYRFNFVSALDTHYQCPQWLNASEMNQTLADLSGDLAWGDVYAITRQLTP